MKKYIILISLLFVAFLATAKCGYWCQNVFIELTKSNDQVYVQPSNDSLKDEVADMVMKSCDSFQKYSKGFIVKQYPHIDKEKCYISNVYVNKYGDTTIVFPGISLMLKPNFVINDILSHFGQSLKVEYSRGCRFHLISNAHNSDEVFEMVEKMASLNIVEWCEPYMSASFKKYNTYYNNQYYLHNTGQNNGTAGVDINAENAWALTEGSSIIKVAVLDDGIDPNHEDFQNALLTGYTLNYSSGHGEPEGIGTDYCHGTACAGIIGARDNNLGIKGVAPNIKMLPVNIFSHATQMNQFATAIDWAADRADILSCSWGKMNVSSNVVISAIQDARTNGRNGKGCVVVFAAGNETANSIAFPANVSGVISVGAIDKNGNHCSYSNTGPELDLVAPSGECNWAGDVWTTDIMNGNAYYGNYMSNFGGTSAACPQVAGVAALMLSANPDLTESQVRSILCSTAIPKGDTIAIPNNTYGYGLVDAFHAVYGAISPKLSIAGNSHLTGTSVYHVENLPDTLHVVWRSSNGMPVTQDTPSRNHCTLVKTNSSPGNFNLYADIYYGSEKLETLYKPIYINYYGSYSQQACNYCGVNHPAIPSQTLNQNYSHFVHMGCTVTLWSPVFFNAEVHHSGITPERWYNPANSSQLQFALPYGSSGMPFHIYSYVDGGASQYHFLFFPVSGNGNLTSSLQVQASGTGYELTLIRQESEQWTGERGDMKWDVEVYDTLRGALMHRAHVKGDSYKLDTSAWRAGTYVVRAVTGDDEEPLVEKIQVK